VKRLGIALVLVLTLAVIGSAQVSVVPRTVGVLLFDNDTGSTVTQLGIIFDKTVEFTEADVIAFGGQKATLVAVSNNYAFIDVVVVPGGTLQIMLTGDSADAQVTSAFWFE
jgi:hypothetical protein